MMDRRSFFVGSAALVACKGVEPNIGQKDHQKLMAITMDDFSLGFDIRLRKAVRHKNILGAFESVDHKAAGFVTGRFVDSTWGDKVVRDWLNEGHLIANHTWAHPHANEIETTEFLSDVKRNSDYLNSVKGVSDFFRFPFLDDGRDRGQQIALFDGLSKLGLRNAPVTIDTVDWYTTSRLEAALKVNPNTDLAPYRDYYVNMCLSLSNHWDQVAQALGLKSMPHLTLMHHNVLNGHFLKDLLIALKEDGWSFVDAAKALEFQSFHSIPGEPTRGRNWLTLKALQTRTKVPAYPKQYHEFGRKKMDALGL